MTYSLMPDGQSVRRDSDGTMFTPDPSSDLPVQRDYQAWLAAGNKPTPFPASNPPPTPAITGRQLNGQARVLGITGALNTVLTSTTSTAKPDDIRYVNSVGLDTQMPIDNSKAARVLTIAGVKDVPGFMAAALLLPA